MPFLRLFAAVSLSRWVEEQVELVLSKVSQYPEIKWGSRLQFHVTLKFIGDWEGEKLSSLEGRLKEVASNFEPFDAEIKGLDGFPNLKHPKVLFVPVTNGQESFVSLSRMISKRLEPLGIGRDDKELRPHVTLGRVRVGQDSSKAVQALRESGLALGAGWKVKGFSLFQSQLFPGGAVHTRLKEFELIG